MGPFYCQPSSLSALGLAFVLGWLLGAVCALLTVGKLNFFWGAPVARPPPAHRLAGYLHAHQHHEGRRGFFGC